jgi:hypothetical protein
MMGRDDSKDAVLARTKNVWPDVYNALIKGIKTAIDLHQHARWDYLDDKHLYQHMIRRKAVEAFHDLKPEPGPGFDESDTGVLPMSGLVLYLPDDVVRIWHIATADIPKPSTPAKRNFVDQPRSDQEPLFGRRHRDEPNHLVLRWTVREHTIERFDLLRPVGTRRRHVVTEWAADLLEKMNNRQHADQAREDDGPP